MAKLPISEIMAYLSKIKFAEQVPLALKLLEADKKITPENQAIIVQHLVNLPPKNPSLDHMALSAMGDRMYMLYPDLGETLAPETQRLGALQEWRKGLKPRKNGTLSNEDDTFGDWISEGGPQNNRTQYIFTGDAVTDHLNKLSITLPHPLEVYKTSARRPENYVQKPWHSTTIVPEAYNWMEGTEAGFRVPSRTPIVFSQGLADKDEVLAPINDLIKYQFKAKGGLMTKSEENKRVGRKIIESAKRGLTSGAARAYKAGSAYLGSGATIGEFVRAYGEAMAPIHQAEYTALTGEKLYPPKLQPARWNNATRNYETIDPNQPTISTAPKNYRAGMYEPKVGPQPIVSPEGVGEFAFDPLNLIGGGTTKSAATGAKYLARGAKAGAKAVARNAAPMIDRMMVEKYGFPSLQPGIVKNTNGEWLTGGTDGPSNLDHALIDLLGSEYPGPPVDEVAAFNQKYRKMLKNYMLNDMGTATDPVRMSIDRGISHADAPHAVRLLYLDRQAEKYGLPKGNLAATQEGLRWENRVDQLIGVANLGEWQKYRPEKFNKSYPWLAQKDPSTIIHDLEDPASFGRLGFDHMRDVLLDKYMAGEITPEQLRNLNMEKAVRIVHEANLAATTGAGEAEAKGYAANLLLPRSKEYASGHYMSELPDPTTSDEAMALVNKIGCEGGWCTQKTGSAIDYGSNRSRLHTLFDSEGRPHVQFEVKKDIPESPTNEEKVAVMKELQRLGLTGTSKESRETYMQLYPEKVYTTIEQMKPPGNTWWSERGQEYLKRNPSYQNDLHVPMQDFVKSGNWNDVKDLDNAGLYKMSQSGMRPALEHRSIAQELGVTPEQLHEFHLSRPENSSPYFTEKEFRDFINMQDTPPIEKAEGGEVHSEFNFDEINNYAQGGIVAHNDFNYGEISKMADQLMGSMYG